VAAFGRKPDSLISKVCGALPRRRYAKSQIEKLALKFVD
jgi:hypothetical protein